MSILAFLSNAIQPVTKLIDSLVTTDEEKSQLHNQLVKLENTFTGRVLEYESKIAQMKADIIMVEAKGESWLQRSWRPVTMLVYLCLIVAHYLNLLAFPVAEEMWSLLKIGTGGYIISRGVEKIIPGIVNKIKKEE